MIVGHNFNFDLKEEFIKRHVCPYDGPTKVIAVNNFTSMLNLKSIIDEKTELEEPFAVQN